MEGILTQGYRSERETATFWVLGTAVVYSVTCEARLLASNLSPGYRYQSRVTTDLFLYYTHIIVPGTPNAYGVIQEERESLLNL